MANAGSRNLPPDALLDALQRHLGFSAFRPGQEGIVRRVLAGEDLFVVMPTGAGKSLCYQLPALMTPGVTLVVSPLIALMKDQVDALLDRRVRGATYINSSLPPAEVHFRLREVAQGKHKLVYVAPERFRSRHFVETLQSLSVSFFVVDEAHCISEWGHDFRPDYLGLGDIIRSLKPRQVLGFTATATQRVRDDAIGQLGVPRMTPVIAEFDRRNLYFEVRSTPTEEEKLGALKSLLASEAGSGIVYVGTRSDAELVADFVQSITGETTGFYHGGLDSAERSRVQEAFMHGDLRVVAATKAFGMGIDKADIRFICHYRLPSSIEAYYQEAGRAGRDDNPSRCVVLYSPDDRALQEYFIKESCPTVDELRTVTAFFQQRAHERVARFDWGEFHSEVGLREEKAEVAMRCLESVEALRRCEEPGGGAVVELLAERVHTSLLHRALQTQRPRQRVKMNMLQAVIEFAESNRCRRRGLLRYFGDPTVIEPRPDCCDNCRATLAPPLPVSGPVDSHGSEIAHAILHCAQTLPTKVGLGKLVGILAGSKAKWVQAGGFDRADGYGLLAESTQAQVKDLVEQLRRQGLLKHIGGEYPIVTVTADGERALADGRPIDLVLPACSKADRETDRRAGSGDGEATLTADKSTFRTGSPPEEPAPSVLETLRLFQETGSVDAVATERELVVSTVYFHLSRLIELGLLDCAQVIPPTRQPPVRDAAKSVGIRQLKPIKDLLGDDFSYEEIRCVVAAIRAERRGRQRERVERQPADSTRQPPEVPDDIREYLQALHPRKLTGNWDAGFAVDFTGRFTGGNYQRTAAGELLYQFKYRHDPQPATELGDLLCRVVRQSPPLSTAEVIVIVPPTQARADFEPVARLAEELGRRMGLPVEPEAIVRARATKHQKEMTNRAQKLANIRGAFRVGNAAAIAGKRVLLLDDFYDSGATLTEATRVLRSRGAAAVLVLTVGKTIHRA